MKATHGIFKLWLLVALTLPLLAAPRQAAAGEDPAGMVREREQAVHAILTDPAIETPAKKSLLVEQISETFDYVELARRSLADHWARLTSTERSDFTGTLKRLIEISILGQLKPNKQYSVNVEQARIEGTEAHLPALVATPTMLPGDEVAVELRLHRSPEKGWVVYDMVIDEVSMLRNYKLQFQKIIHERSFGDLLQQMKRKLALESPS